MNKTFKYGAIGLAALCLVYPALAWLIGLQVEANMARREQLVTDQFPGTITVVSRHYQRGIFGASEELTLGLGPAMLRALAPASASADLAAQHVIVHTTIYHGPLPQFRSVGLAAFNVQVDLPAELSARIHALLGGDPSIQIRGRLHWLGGSTVELTSPDYHGQLAGGTVISWRGVDATSSANADLSSSALDGTVAGFELKSATGQAELDGLHVSTDWKRVFDVLYTGPMAMKIATVKWQSVPAARQFLMQGISISGAGSVEGDYFKSSVEFAADAIQTPKFSATHALYAISAEHLHGPTLAAMTKDMRAGQADPAASAQAVSQAALQTLKKNGIELLLHEPVINIAQAGFAMPEGELRCSATVSVPGLKREDLDGPQMQMALIQHLNVVADLRIDTALANRLMETSPQKDALSGQMAALEKQGYIKIDGAAMTAHLTFSAGKLLINGLPFPAAPVTN